MIDFRDVALTMVDEVIASITVEDIRDELITMYDVDTSEAGYLAYVVAEQLDNVRVEIEES